MGEQQQKQNNIIKYLKDNNYYETLNAFQKEILKKINDNVVTDSNTSSSSTTTMSKKKKKKNKQKKNKEENKSKKKKEKDEQQQTNKLEKKKKEDIDEKLKKMNDDDEDTDVSDVSSVSTTDVSSEEESDSDDDDDDEIIKEHYIKKQKALEKTKKAAKEAADNWTPKNKQQEATNLSCDTKGGIPFSRVDSNYWGAHAAKDGVDDNTYHGAFGNDGFGARSSERLVKVRGKDFRHEKTKRKRTFNGFSKREGGSINAKESHSIKFTYQSD